MQSDRTRDLSGWFHVGLFKILQNEQLDEISPMGNEEVSAVSQAWFTTKEDKDSLTNKGRIYQMPFSHAVKR